MNDKNEKAVGSTSGSGANKPAHRINDSEDAGTIRFDSSLNVPKGKLVTESFKDKTDGFKKNK